MTIRRMIQQRLQWLKPLVDWLDCTSLVTCSKLTRCSLPPELREHFRLHLQNNFLLHQKHGEPPLDLVDLKRLRKVDLVLYQKSLSPFLGCLSVSSGRRLCKTSLLWPPTFLFFQCFQRARRQPLLYLYNQYRVIQQQPQQSKKCSQRQSFMGDPSGRAEGDPTMTGLEQTLFLFFYVMDD